MIELKIKGLEKINRIIIPPIKHRFDHFLERTNQEKKNKTKLQTKGRRNNCINLEAIIHIKIGL
ncbi:MAG: hypothetical protein ACPG5P_07290 [Saprospiraceae bacterium]